MLDHDNLFTKLMTSNSCLVIDKPFVTACFEIRRISFSVISHSMLNEISYAQPWLFTCNKLIYIRKFFLFPDSLWSLTHTVFGVLSVFIQALPEWVLTIIYDLIYSGSSSFFRNFL